MHVGHPCCRLAHNVSLICISGRLFLIPMTSNAWGLAGDQKALIHRRRSLPRGEVTPITEIKGARSVLRLNFQGPEIARVDGSELRNQIDVGAAPKPVRNRVTAMVGLARAK